MSQPISGERNRAIFQVASQLTGPITFDEFVTRVLALYPTRAKDPKGGIRSELRYRQMDFGLIYADDRRSVLLPLAHVMPGVRFRHRFTQQEIESGILFVDENETVFFPGRSLREIREDLQLIDENGSVLQSEIIRRSEKVESAFGSSIEARVGYRLVDWFLAHPAQAGDSALFTIETWEPPRWQIEHEPRMKRDEAAIAIYNEKLVDILFDLLELETSEELLSANSVITACIRLAQMQSYPGDPWTDLLRHDGRMHYDGWRITYSDGKRNFFDMLNAISDEEDETEKYLPLSEEEAGKVYQFKAYLIHQPGIWRRVEILGGQTLAALNDCLIEAFNHEPEHLAGFWKLLKRGKSKRIREVDIGNVDPFDNVSPFGEKAVNDLLIANLAVTTGMELKYIYDFINSIEHRLLLENVAPAETALADTEYPRIVERNLPKYKYCENCKKEGKKVVALWDCYTCAEQQQRDVLLCEECAEKFHDDHYVVEMLY